MCLVRTFLHRYHGLFGHVPHQAEEGGDGNTGTATRVDLVLLALGQAEVLIWTHARRVPSSAPQRSTGDGRGGSHPRGCAGTEMAVWAQVKVLELEKRLEGERVRLGELRKQHYALAGTYDAAEDGEAKPAPAPRRGILKKPPLAQKPGQGEVGSPGGKYTPGRGPFTAGVTDISLFPRSRFSPSETPARTRLTGRTSSRGWLCLPQISLPSRWCAFVRGGSPCRPAWKTG